VNIKDEIAELYEKLIQTSKAFKAAHEKRDWDTYREAASELDSIQDRMHELYQRSLRN
jgi:hypothetical protein